MRTCIPITLALAVLLVLACQDLGPTGPATDNALSEQTPVASRGQPGKLLPLQGDLTGGLTGQIFAPGFPFERDVFDSRCSVPSDWVVEFTATGVISHLGKVTVVIEHCSQIDFQTGNATYSDGVFTSVAANGDELWGTYHSGTSGPLSATEVWWQDTFVLTGGTGRFAHASGGGVERGTVLIPTLEIPEWTVDGMIAYDASDRAR